MISRGQDALSAERNATAVHKASSLRLPSARVVEVEKAEVGDASRNHVSPHRHGEHHEDCFR